MHGKVMCTSKSNRKPIGSLYIIECSLSIFIVPKVVTNHKILIAYIVYIAIPIGIAYDF